MSNTSSVRASVPNGSSVLVERVLDHDRCRDLDTHVARGGMRGLEAARAVDPAVVVDTIEAAGLRGRGGAGFPTGLKWRTVQQYSSPDGPASVVVNGAEGEPGTFKDRALIRANPYRVLEGALIGCHAMGATELVIAIKRSFTSEAERLRRAVAELRADSWIDGIDVRVELGPSHYLFGEETAMLNVLEGGQPFPRVTPPYRRGLDLDGTDETEVHDLATNDPDTGTPPVLVNNVETFANVPGILANGPEWFRGLGTDESPGTIVCTITGSTVRHGVGEVPMGTPLTLAIDAIGGGPRDGHHLVGAISGVANAFVASGAFDTPLSYEAMSAIGSGLGSAGFIVFDDGDDLHDAAAQISRFLAVESCGQCEPCKRDGLAIAATFDSDETADDDTAARTAATRRDLLATVADGARCALARQHQDVISSMLPSTEAPRTPPADEAETEAPTVERTPAATMVLPIADLIDGRALYDETQLDKQPDWTFDGTDSGVWPAANESPISIRR